MKPRALNFSHTSDVNRDPRGWTCPTCKTRRYPGETCCPPEVERNPMKTEIWSCKIGEHHYVPPGADAPMRRAVERAYAEITGEHPAFIFSGWGAELTEGERAVVENRDPDLSKDEVFSLRAEVERLKGALREADTFFRHNFDELSHWHECEQKPEDAEDPPNEDCNCQVGMLAKMRAALSPEPKEGSKP